MLCEGEVHADAVVQCHAVVSRSGALLGRSDGGLPAGGRQGGCGAFRDGAGDGH